jgi:hypothetical protein
MLALQTRQLGETFFLALIVEVHLNLTAMVCNAR